MKNELNNILNDLREVCKEQNLRLTDSELMDFSLRIYNTQEINKFKNIPKTKEQINKQNNLNPLTKKEEPATKPQIYFLKSQGKTIPAGLTKQEANKIIKELKK